jgi:hypothetical protein
MKGLKFAIGFASGFILPAIVGLMVGSLACSIMDAAKDIRAIRASLAERPLPTHERINQSDRVKLSNLLDRQVAKYKRGE